MKAIEYQLQPEVVAKTMLCHLEGEAEQLGVLSIPRQGSPLFQVEFDQGQERLRLLYVDSEFSFGLTELESVRPDPLWSSAEGICRHMEEDHRDTFDVFLQSVGVEVAGEDVRMSWIERAGFFLSLLSEDTSRHIFIHFPQVCETPGEVRKMLIKMLKEMRS